MDRNNSNQKLLLTSLTFVLVLGLSTTQASAAISPLFPDGREVSIPQSENKPQVAGDVLAQFVPGGTTGNGRGVAFDGTDLYYSIDGDTNIYKVDTTGTLLNTISVPGGDPRTAAGGPLTWDGTNLWTANYDGSFNVWRINPITGATVSSCNISIQNPGHAALAGLDFPDGLHWTGSGLVISGEISVIGRQTAVAFLDTSCNITSFFLSPGPLDGQWSGVSVVGSTLWHTDPFALLMEESDFSGVLSGNSFSTGTLQIEDTEYDPITFAPLCAIWGNEATFGSNHLTAWEVPGDCSKKVVGGESLPIDSSALLLAGVQTNSVWILSALAVIGSVAFGTLYIKTKRD